MSRVKQAIESLSKRGYEETYWEFLSPRERDLTETLCYSDEYDFIVLDDEIAYMLVDSGSRWEAEPIGKPAICLNELFQKLKQEIRDSLEHELQGVEIKEDGGDNDTRFLSLERVKAAIKMAVEEVID